MEYIYLENSDVIHHIQNFFKLKYEGILLYTACNTISEGNMHTYLKASPDSLPSKLALCEQQVI